MSMSVDVKEQIERIAPLEIAGAMKQICYKCGCMAQFPIVGEFSSMKEWHIFRVCSKHNPEDISIMEMKAELDFQTLIGERS